MRVLQKVRGAPRRTTLAALVIAGVVMAAPTIATALPGVSGGQPPPGAPTVNRDPSSLAPVPAQPPAGAPAVPRGQVAKVPAQPVNPNPQPAGPPVQKPSDEKPGVSSGPDLGTEVSSAPE